MTRRGLTWIACRSGKRGNTKRFGAANKEIAAKSKKQGNPSRGTSSKKRRFRKKRQKTWQTLEQNRGQGKGINPFQRRRNSVLNTKLRQAKD